MLKVLAGMNLLDAAVMTAGSLEDLFVLAQANGKSITDELVPGEELKPTGIAYKPSSATSGIVRETNQVLIMSGQTLLDLAMQETGSVEGVFQLAVLNGLALTDELSEGNSLKYPTQAVDRVVRKAFQDNNWKPSSAKTVAGQQLPPTLEGIGYWTIEVDFRVS